MNASDPGEVGAAVGTDIAEPNVVVVVVAVADMYEVKKVAVAANLDSYVVVIHVAEVAVAPNNHRLVVIGLEDHEKGVGVDVQTGHGGAGVGSRPKKVWIVVVRE